ncbi:MAG: methyltransferase domain-containing protein, partial [Pseudomonadota bacterium]
MEFLGTSAALQRRMAETRDLAQRRLAILHELAPRRGERVLEIGCGAGLLLREIALATGAHGLAAGVDISPDQVAAA